MTGCSTSAGYLPRWSRATGDGAWKASGASRSCGTTRGGNTYPSGTDVEAQLEVGVPFHPPTGAGGINVTWDLDLAATTSGSTTSYVCPTTNYSYAYDWGYTWYNFSERISFCTAEADVFLYGSAYVVDQHTGAAYYPSNFWSAPFNISGVYNDSYRYTVNYSNSSYWSYNATYASAINQSWGSNGSLTGTFAPTWFINGTFLHAHEYFAETYVYGYVTTSVVGFRPAKAAATIDLASGGRHWDLDPLSIW